MSAALRVPPPEFADLGETSTERHEVAAVYV